MSVSKDLKKNSPGKTIKTENNADNKHILNEKINPEKKKRSENLSHHKEIAH